MWCRANQEIGLQIVSVWLVQHIWHCRFYALALHIGEGSVQHSAARFVKNDYRRNTNPADLITALGWPTLERRRIIKQATTFYKILNNIIEITPPPGLLTRSRTRGQYIAPKCRINAMVFSFYPRAIRIWNMIPSKITNIKNPKSFQEAIMELPFTTPPHLNCL